MAIILMPAWHLVVHAQPLVYDAESDIGMVELRGQLCILITDLLHSYAVSIANLFLVVPPPLQSLREKKEVFSVVLCLK
jgi:hypothetical protein